MKDSRIDLIEMIDLLKELYADRVGPTVFSVKMCQNQKDIWLCIKRRKQTVIGILEREEIMDLGFIVEEPEHPAFEDDEPLFSPKRDVYDNAVLFCKDSATIEHVTSIFEQC